MANFDPATVPEKIDFIEAARGLSPDTMAQVLHEGALQVTGFRNLLLARLDDIPVQLDSGDETAYETARDNLRTALDSAAAELRTIVDLVSSNELS